MQVRGFRSRILLQPFLTAHTLFLGAFVSLARQRHQSDRGDAVIPPPRGHTCCVPTTRDRVSDGVCSRAKAGVSP